MNIKHTKKPEQRIDVKFLSSLGIKTYGDNNLYPQTIRDIVAASPAGRTCVERRATYIEGNGLASQALSDAICDAGGCTVDDVHHLCADDVSYHDGFALHVNYSILGQIVSMSHIPFENCRLEEEDENGVISHVIVHPDWRGKRTRSGKAVKVSAETIDVLPVFNPSPEVVQRQMVSAGGIEYYKGQILYASKSGRLAYPLPIYDAVLTDMSTDEGLTNVNNRNVRNNFLTAGMLITKRGQGSGKDENNNDDEGFASDFVQLQGDTNACKIMHAEIEMDEEAPAFVPFKTNNFDKEYTVTTGSVIEDIYAAFGQEMFCRLRKGSIGFTGELASDVKREYCEQVSKQQRMLTRAYKAVFDNWRPGGLPYIDIKDVAIEPLVSSVNDAGPSTIPSDILKDLTTNERRQLAGFDKIKTADNEQQLLSERIGVGGTQSMISIMTDQAIDEKQKKELLVLLFGLSESDASKLFNNGQASD